MKTIIAGSRDCTDMRELLQALRDCGWLPSHVVSGGARGADRLGELWAVEHNIPFDRFPADWGVYGKRAGFIRNEQMASVAEALIALWDGKSAGTRHAINIAVRYGLRTHVHITGRLV